MVQTGTLTALFHDLVQEAMEQQHIASSETTECYLVHMLERFAAPGRTDLLDPPLGVDYMRAFEMPAVQRFDTLKRVADTSLFVTGVFVDCLERSLVGADYYTALGRNAYAQLSNEMRRGGLAESFVELADRFPDFVRVLGAMGVHGCGGTRRFRGYLRACGSPRGTEVSAAARRGFRPRVQPARAVPRARSTPLHRRARPPRATRCELHAVRARRAPVHRARLQAPV